MTSIEENTNLIDKEQGENKGETKEVEEVKPSGPSLISEFGRFILAFIFECFGSFLFFSAILLGSNVEATCIAFWIILTIVAPFSGGHLNPAVTLAYYIYDMKLLSGIPKVIMYTLAQLGGGALAVLLSEEMREPTELKVAGHSNESKEFIAEFFFTSTFIFVYLFSTSKVTRLSSNKLVSCGMIAAWLYFAATSASKESIGALNPAVLVVFTVYNNNNKRNYYQKYKDEIWKVGIAEFSAAAAMAILFFLVEKSFPENPEEKKEEETVVEKKAEWINIESQKFQNWLTI